MSTVFSVVGLLFCAYLFSTGHVFAGVIMFFASIAVWASYND